MTTNSQYQEAQGFINTFNPWRKSYFIRPKLQGLKDKITVKEYLSLQLIQAAIDGAEEIGFFITKRTHVIGIDIDDHSNVNSTSTSNSSSTSSEVISIDSFNNITLSKDLQLKYQNVLLLMQSSPSLSVISPHGLHLYWLIDKPLLWENISLLIKDKLKAKLAPIFNALSIELKPTPNITLRIPSRDRIFNPETLTFLYKDSLNRIDWSLAPIYPAESILGNNYRAKLHSLKFHPNRKSKLKPKIDSSDVESSIKTSLGSDKSSQQSKTINSFINNFNLEKDEKKILPFKNGESNTQLIKLVALYKRNKLSVNSMLSRVNHFVNLSSGYSGDLAKNQSQLENRIKSLSNFENTNPSMKLSALNEISISTIDSAILKNLACSHPFIKQRTASIEKFLLNLFRLKKHHDSFSIDKMLDIDDQNPFYYKNRLEGFYPLPSKLLQIWNRNYKSIIDWLIKLDILSNSPYPFSPNGKICKYYKINL